MQVRGAAGRLRPALRQKLDRHNSMNHPPGFSLTFQSLPLSISFLTDSSTVTFHHAVCSPVFSRISPRTIASSDSRCLALYPCSPGMYPPRRPLSPFSRKCFPPPSPTSADHSSAVITAPPFPVILSPQLSFRLLLSYLFLPSLPLTRSVFSEPECVFVCVSSCVTD